MDGEEWVKVGSKDHNTPETIYGETFDLSGQGIRAAYVKLVGIFNSANSAYHVNEIRAYGTEVLPEPEPEVVATGWSGYTTWVLTDDGTITFSPTEERFDGKCNMANYHKVNGVLSLPWDAYAEQITKVVIEEGINAVGQMAFYELPNLQEVVLPESIGEVRNYAFKNVTSLTTINLEAAESIREGAFYGCSGLENIQFAEGVVIEDWAFFKTPVVLP